MNPEQIIAQNEKAKLIYLPKLDQKFTLLDLKNNDKSSTWLIYISNFSPSNETSFSEIWNTRPREPQYIMLYGNKIKVPRNTRAYGLDYAFSGQVSLADPWTPQLQQMINSIKEIDKSTEYNSGLINWYQPEHYIGQHADDESNCVKNSNIASVSWGCTRRFRLTSKTHHSITLDLKDGDLVIMGGTCQKTHKHEIMKLRKKDIHKNRINFTFRSFKT